MANRQKRLTGSKRRSSSIHQQFESQTTIQQESGVDQIIEICKKPVLFRKPHETKLLINNLRSIKFFKEQFNEHYEGMLEDVAENAKLHIYSKNETIIKQDSFGDTFYIIIKGSAKVVKRVVTYIGSQVTKKGKKREKYHEEVKEIMQLHDGDYFGELALLERKPRGADVIAQTELYALGLDKDSFDRIMATKTKRQFLHLLDVLSCNSILREISKNTVKALFMIMERKVFNYGDVIFQWGEEGNSLYFIIEGEFKMTSQIAKDIETQDGNDYQHFERIAEVCIIGKNETIGLEEFLDEELRKWKAVCQSQIGIVYKLNRVDYKRIEQRYPDIVEAIQKIRDEKKAYYDQWKDQYAVPETAGIEKIEQNSNQKFDFSQYSARAKQLKSIIMNDKEMSFISRDQVTINDDQEIMLRYCPYFQLGDKKATPFLVNTIEQIQQKRIKSAGYRPVISQSATNLMTVRPKTAKLSPQHQSMIKEQQEQYENSMIKKKNIDSQPTTTINQLLTTQPQDDNKRSTLISPTVIQSITPTPTQPQENKRIILKKKARTYNDVIQNKMINFMKLTPQKIETMAIKQRIDKEEYQAKKLYIKKYPTRSVDQILTRIQSALSNKAANVQSARKQRQNICRGTASSVNLMNTQDRIPTGDCSRIHSTKNSTGIQIDTSALPLKYQAEMINKQFIKKSKILSPISTFTNKNMIRYKQISTEC